MFWRCVGTGLVVAFSLALSLRASDGDTPPDVCAMIDGVLARSRAIFSGRMNYHFEITSEKGPPAFEARIRYTFSGASWVQRIDRGKEPDGYVTSHNGACVEYIATLQPNGRVTSLARVRPAVTPDAPGAAPPVFAGTLWAEETIAFIRDHRNEVTRVGEVEINGVRAAVLEWVVPEALVGKTFDSVSPPLFKGARLRLYVAREWGFVLPRIEVLSPTGKMGLRFDATDFRAIPPSGIYFPRACAECSFDKDQHVITIKRYTISDVSDLNEPIGDDQFAAPIPVGTEVLDERSGQGSSRFIVKLNEPPPVSGLEGVMTPVTPPPPVRSNLRLWACVIGLLAGAVLVVARFIAIRRRATAP